MASFDPNLGHQHRKTVLFQPENSSHHIFLTLFFGYIVCCCSKNSRTTKRFVPSSQRASGIWNLLTSAKRLLRTSRTNNLVRREKILMEVGSTSSARTNCNRFIGPRDIPMSKKNCARKDSNLKTTTEIT